jgi:hypothetical protein
MNDFAAPLLLDRGSRLLAMNSAAKLMASHTATLMTSQPL